MYKVYIENGGHETTIHSPFFNELKLPSGQIKQEINIANGFTFNILPHNPGYNLMHPLQTLIKVFNTQTGKFEFEGRILTPKESMSESGTFAKSFICESELGFLNDSRQRHGEFHNITVREFLQKIIENHNADVADDPIDKTFEVGIVDIDSSTGELYRYLGYESTMETINDKLISRLGGELRVRKVEGVRYLDYMQSIGERKETEIRVSKNLKSITKEVDPTDVITRLIPLGERIESESPDATDASQARLTIDSVNDGKSYIIDHDAEQTLGTVVVGTKIWDDITQANILKTRGTQHLQENNRMKKQHQIDALDLSLLQIDPDAFEVGNWHPVINPAMNIDEDMRIIGKTIDINIPENNGLTIGDRFIKASDYQKEANKSKEKIIDLEETVERQTKRITSIREELTSVDESLESLQEAFNNADLPEIESAISDLLEAVGNLTDAVDSIPDYAPATSGSDGLMSKEDKSKIDLISVLQSIDLDAIRTKLELISVTDNVNLDDMLERIEALEEE